MRGSEFLIISEVYSNKYNAIIIPCNETVTNLKKNLILITRLIALVPSPPISPIMR